VAGLGEDLLPKDERFWQLIGHTRLVSFDEAARRAMADERPRPGISERLARVEEKLVDLTGVRRPRG